MNYFVVVKFKVFGRKNFNELFHGFAYAPVIQKHRRIMAAHRRKIALNLLPVDNVGRAITFQKLYKFGY